MRRHRATGAPTDDLLLQDEPLDEEEQDAVISGLEAQAAAADAVFSGALCVLAALVAAFFLHAALQQARHPWTARYTGELRPVIGDGRAAAAALAAQGAGAAAAASALALSRLGCGASGPAPRPGRRGRGLSRDGQGARSWSGARGRGRPGALLPLLLAAGALLSGGGGAYWAAALRRAAAAHGGAGVWPLVWLPLLPLLSAGGAAAAHASARGNAAELAALRRLRYDFKKV